MFWWGNYFSCTLHLQGKQLDSFRQKLFDNLTRYVNEGVYICVNESPWEYHFEPDNYRRLTLDDKEFMQKCGFLKLSKRIELELWKELPDRASEYLDLLLGNIFSGRSD
jgi:hypothetical protein